MWTLGISAFYHDSAAAIIKDGQVVAAAQEERFTRRKFDASFPLQSIQYCLSEAGIKPNQIDIVSFYDEPKLKLDRLFQTHINGAPHGFPGFWRAADELVRGKADQSKLIVNGLTKLDSQVNWRERLVFCNHHESHAASAYYPSPYSHSAILTMDGVGEWATTTIAVGKGTDLTLLKEIRFPHSIGLLYAAFTDYLGFRVNSDEYKVMGLAPYGKPVHVDVIRNNLIDIKEDGSYCLNMEYFAYDVGRTMTNENFSQLFGRPNRTKSDDLEDFHMDMAASVQAITEEATRRLARHAMECAGSRNLCLAGGVALNCVANGKLLHDPRPDSIWIQPAAGDAGGALGAALLAGTKSVRPVGASASDGMKGAFLGPAYTDSQIKEALEKRGLAYQQYGEGDLMERVATELASGKVVGWFQGRMEFGPRALGARSILADPRNPSMQRILNLKIKFRESFRPFAPVVLEERTAEWFELAHASPYMLLVAPVHPSKRRRLEAAQEQIGGINRLEALRSEIPAVTHVDYSARVQTVGKDSNPRYRKVLEAFYRQTGCPVLVNTSFNVNEEPIVCSPDDAIRCFLSTNIDILCVGSFVVARPQENMVRSIPPVDDANDKDNIYTVF